ncbi:MAG: DNA polymerase I [Candidatus Omnitrophica bacterium CG23_combo_of_CG06-09_8_20_14_all_40_11]|nr:MAG: DNA polymerase I [Candidatus Omnitrophica bacterium CG23_combo_of_CG06-09_8_20_14_all_40_11]
MIKPKLFLIDATAFCYRAFYAIGRLSTSFGQPTNAIYGFINMLNKVLKEKKPQFLAVCFDVSRNTFRLKKFAEYKIKRPPMPDELSGQIPLIKEVISAYGITIFEQEGYEADDIIATLAKKAKEKGVSTTVVSSDKDILQLVDDDITVFSPYKDEGIIYDEKKVSERFGVGPKMITDIIALMGDDADNIPSVPGIGEKTAASLIKEFGSVEKLLSNIDKIKSEKIKIAIKDNIDTVKLNKELAVLDKKIDLDFNLDKLKISEPNYQELFRLFKLLEFKKLLKDLEVKEDKSPDIELTTLEDKELKDLIKPQDELVLYGDSFDSLIFYANPVRNTKTLREESKISNGAKDKFFRLTHPGINLKAILSNPEIKKIGHDLKKMNVSLAKEDTALEGLYFDTMVAGYLINPSKSGYNLNDLAWDYLGEFLKPGSLNNLKALSIIKQLKPKLERELCDKSLFNLFTEIEMPLVEVLSQMELTGIKIDLEILNKLSRDLEKRLVKLVEDIYSVSGSQFNINSPKQLRSILFEKLKLPIVKRSKTGPSTDEEVLRKLADKHKLPHFLLEYRQLTKLKSTYIDALPNLLDPETGRIHTSFNQTATETGRLSSSGPNLQNLPIKTDLGKNIRRAVIAFSKDSYLLSCDYSQVELRILAHLSKDKNLILAFKNDKDVHKITASFIYGLEEKDITDSMRETAKRVNFGIIYGLTSFGLSRDLGISVDEAQAFIEAYFSRYPQVKDYVQEQITRAKKEGFVTTILGRRRYIPEINNKNQSIRQFAERQAINTPIQGSASDLIKLAMVRLYEEIKTSALKTRMIMQIHDELVFDVPKEEIVAFVDLARDKMENVFKLDVPIKVDIKKGKNWLEMEDIKCG